jgi:hypothetical protein
MMARPRDGTAEAIAARLTRQDGQSTAITRPIEGRNGDNPPRHRARLKDNREMVSTGGWYPLGDGIHWGVLDTYNPWL